MLKNNIQVTYITLPNCGTHILQPVFGEEVEEAGGLGIFEVYRFGDDCISAHIPHSSFTEVMLRKGGRHVIFQIRDPR